MAREMESQVARETQGDADGDFQGDGDGAGYVQPPFGDSRDGDGAGYGDPAEFEEHRAHKGETYYG